MLPIVKTISTDRSSHFRFLQVNKVERISKPYYKFESAPALLGCPVPMAPPAPNIDNRVGVCSLFLLINLKGGRDRMPRKKHGHFPPLMFACYTDRTTK